MDHSDELQLPGMEELSFSGSVAARQDWEPVEYLRPYRRAPRFQDMYQETIMKEKSGTDFEFIHRKLCFFEMRGQWAEDMLDELQLLKLELRFLDRFSQCSATQAAGPLSKLFECDRRGYRRLSSELVEKIERSKFEVKQWCECSLPLIWKPSTSDEILMLFDNVLHNLKDFLSYKKGNIVPPKLLETFEVERAFLKNLLEITANCIDREELQEFRTCIQIFVKEAANLTFLCCVNAREEGIKDEGIDLMISDILQKFEVCTRDMRASHFGSLTYKASTRNEILTFLDALLRSIWDLKMYKADKVFPVKKQLEILKGKVVFLQNFFRLSANGIDRDELQEFRTCVHVFAQNAACLTFLCWSKTTDEDLTSKTDLMLSEMLHKLKAGMPAAMVPFSGALKAVVLEQSNSLLLGQTVASFIDLLLDNLGNHLKHETEILWEGLMFLLTFVADPPDKVSKDEDLTLVHKQIDVLLWEGSSLIASLNTKEYFSRRKVLLCNFAREIELVNSKIRQLYCKIPDSSRYNFPRITGLGLLDFLIQNLRTLKEKQSTDARCLPFAKYKIIRIEEELVSLRPFFLDIMEFQNEQKELNDTRLQVIDLVHLAEHVTNSCFDSNHPIWYHMAYLSDVMERIKVLNKKCEQMKECNMYKVGVFLHSASSLGIISEQARAPDIHEIVVGFDEEANIIVEKLTRGHQSLDTVSVVGMAGIGKTTLARKVYGTPLVKCCFNIFAFSVVSKDHSTRRILLDILSHIILIDDDISRMTKEDLAHRLWKHLSLQKYLIVLDDVWDIRAWNKVKSSFPDDHNGSRVMLTTRSHQVAAEAQIKCSPYTLGFLSEEKSWELLQKKVFHNGNCPPVLSEVGKLIAKKCNGLPLAVVVLAGLLARNERSLSQWSEISKRVVFYLSEKGFMEILELSYKHLPWHLKPCLLYFGAIQKDMMIPTKILTLSWIAEGFVQESERKSLVNVANEYLNDLADRSLIIVNGRSSSDGIKTFRIHNLVHDFCRIKARAENFFLLGHGIEASSSSNPPLYNHYRVCLQAGEANLDATPPFPSMHSLLCFQRCNKRFHAHSIVENFKLVQVLYLENMWLEEGDLRQLTLLVHLREIVANVLGQIGNVVSVPSSISSLWKLETFILRTMMKCEALLPETIWTMERLRHVNISRCKLTLFGGHKLEGYPQLGNVESFSSPTLSTRKDLQELLQRFPVVRKLSCRFDKSSDSVDREVERLDFDSAIESLNLAYIGDKNPYVINFPSTLKKLKLVGFKLPWTAILDISKLPCLEVLKLLWNSFVGPNWDMEDVEFQRLKFLKMNGLNLVRWNASPDSFPCLEQLFVIGCEDLIEVPACFGELSTLRRFAVEACNSKAAKCAYQIKNDQMELGNKLLPLIVS